MRFLLAVFALFGSPIGLPGGVADFAIRRLLGCDPAGGGDRPLLWIRGRHAGVFAEIRTGWCEWGDV